ncbi:MAG: rod shape-determining protein MreD [Acetobacterales bacterium]
MTTTFWRRADLLASAVTPFCVTLLLILSGLVHSRVPELASVAPVLPLAAIYFWSVYRPGLMPYLAVFALGIMFDLLSGVPLGLNAVVFMLVRLITVSQRRFLVGKPFLMVWWGYMMIAAGAAFAAWVLSSVATGRLLPTLPPVFQLLLTVGVYPLVSWLLVKADAGLVQSEA